MPTPKSSKFYRIQLPLYSAPPAGSWLADALFFYQPFIPPGISKPNFQKTPGLSEKFDFPVR